MILYKKAESVTEYLIEQKKLGKTIGLVPTMGALHEGHLSLIELSKQNCDITVCSIFVNPTQFNDPKDFEKYPVTVPNDLHLLEAKKCDVVFLPSVSEIYPGGVKAVKHYDLSDLENLLEGKYRPGHFQGVCKVVDRLLNIVKPDKTFLGQKDYQQCMVIQRLINLLELPIELVLGNTIREAKGLAMSSRNSRLGQDDKQKATAIYSALNYIKEHYGEKLPAQLEEDAARFLKSHGFDAVDYVSIVNGTTLKPVNESNSNNKIVALIAAFIGGIRLIDNMVVKP
ncbi:MAG: pantoate--beta-alanine ligase [Segetibacter sp.]|nr:pantoate--beta-alanine ligase [Segetibacter sp.]